MRRQSKRSRSSRQAVFDPFLAYQKQALVRVSRTFALTIPLLPTQVRHVIGNAYLLCRIADTIEDEPTLDVARKRDFLSRFTEVVQQHTATDSFAHELAGLLSEATKPGERDLVLNTSSVINYHSKLPSGQRKPIERCVEIMCKGMAEFVGTGESGLPTMEHVERYCYYVAGVVGEMLTDVFSDYSSGIEAQRDKLTKLAVQFGRGLQLVNILKDHPEDRRRGVTWLPRRILRARSRGTSEEVEASLERRVMHVVRVAQRDFEAALRYVELIPVSERGVRAFLAITLGLAILTLRRINSNPGFRRGDDVKISRKQVYGTVAATSVAVRSNVALKWLFNRAKPGFVATPDSV